MLSSFLIDSFTLLFVVAIGVIYWTMDKEKGFHLQLLLAASIFLNHIIHEFTATIDAPSLEGTWYKDLLYPNLWTQNLTILIGALRFETGRLKTTMLSGIIISVILLLAITFFETNIISIISGLLFGIFLVIALYRQEEWMNELLDRDRLLLMIFVPFIFWAIHPTQTTSIVCGYILGAGVGYQLEAIKLRMILRGPFLKKIGATSIGIIGVIVILFIFSRSMSNPFSLFLCYLSLGLWTYYLAPFVFIKSRLYRYID
ncbi:hypothetical protein [Massilibacterium senegalense]|uniref:hypothetical protein n=1 Tax=Massilibacterium senegalense TaxID=1632858 RepID=UPI000784CF5E|nr:hypothetical protein [Massilibacterium senegalense]